VAEAKKVIANIKLQVQAGKATPAPPVGSTLGQYGLNMMEFINPFNEQTKDMGDVMVTAHVKVLEDRTFTFRIVGATTESLIKKAAGIEKGSGEPNKTKIGKLSQAQVKEIAEKKLNDFNTDDVEAASKIVAGTARSMGVEVE
jgi:large subunit ribosomal protein L11